MFNKKKQPKNEIGPIKIKGGEFDGVTVKLLKPDILGDQDNGTSSITVSYEIMDAKDHIDLDHNPSFTQVMSKLIQALITGNSEYEYPFGNDDTEILDTERGIREEGSTIPEA